MTRKEALELIIELLEEVEGSSSPEEALNIAEKYGVLLSKDG